MLSFLNPIVLVGLAAAAIPILIHFLTRSKAKVTPFSTLTFLKELQQRKVRRLKLRQILLLIIRTLILVLLVLAFARPTARYASYGGTGPSAAQTSMVIILDNSASMAREVSGRRLYDLAADLAKEVGGQLLSGGDVRLVLPSSPPSLASQATFHDAKRFGQVVDAQDLSYSSTDLSGAVKMARELLDQSHNINKEIFLISDLQETAFATSARDTDLTGTQRLFVMSVDTRQFDNLSVEHVEVVSKIIEKGRPVQIKALIQNYGGHAQRNRLVQVSVEGKRVAQTTVSLEPGEAREVDFNFVPSINGLLSGSVVVEDEGQVEDDERHFVLDVPESISVQLVGETQESGPFRLALNPTHSQKAFYRITRATGESLPFGSLSGYDVVVLCDVPRLENSWIGALRYCVENGGGLLLLPGSRLDLKWYSSVFCPTMGLPLFVGGIGQVADPGAAFEFDRVDYTHPVFYGVFEEKQKEARSPRFHFALKTRVEDVTKQNVIEFSTGDPFLYEARVGQGHVLVFTSGMEETWSNLATTTLFAPLMSRCVRYLAASGSHTKEQILVGAAIKKRLAPDLLGINLEMVTPDNRAIALLPKELGDGYVVEFGQTAMPGVYRLLSDGQEIDRWAVNMDPRESLAQPIAESELRKLYPSLIYLDPERDLKRQVAAVREGREYWKPILVVVLVLLIVEMILYREKGEVVDEPSRKGVVA